jgi:hypothetical protein
MAKLPLGLFEKEIMTHKIIDDRGTGEEAACASDYHFFPSLRDPEHQLQQPTEAKSEAPKEDSKPSPKPLQN